MSKPNRGWQQRINAAIADLRPIDSCRYYRVPRDLEENSMHLKESANAPDTLEQDANAYFTVSSEAIVEEPQSVISQTRCQSADPVIARFRASLTNIQTSELERLYGRLPQLDDHSKEVIQQFADCLVSKMLHPPLECLRNEGHNQSSDELIDALQRLFRLS